MKISTIATFNKALELIIQIVMKTPAWYELGLSQNGQAVQIRVHRVALQALQAEPWDTAPLVTEAKLPFTKPQEGDCGFGDAFKLVSSTRPDWIVWEFALPKIRENSVESIESIRQTIYAFLSLSLRTPDINTGWGDDQLINILAFETGEEGRGCAGLGARLSETVVSWLKDESNHRHFPQIAEAMKTAYKFMTNGNEGRNGRFEASFRNGWFTLTTSGDATYINGEAEDTNCEIGPHNVDSIVQQLSLLCGLAALHDLIRKR